MHSYTLAQYLSFLHPTGVTPGGDIDWSQQVDVNQGNSKRFRRHTSCEGHGPTSPPAGARPEESTCGHILNCAIHHPPQ